ncbi:MAG TPA: hypothetical protein VMR70_09860 [Flavisolibacter sp.]|nr:hypothetical protein [Flavisolibacter sp.]
MIDNIELAQISSNKLEIHYWLADNSHLMDANVENKCNYEVLGIIKEVAKNLSIEVIIETEPLGEGGLRKWLRITAKEEDKKGTITSAIIIAIVTTLLVSPIGKFSETVIEKMFEDTELQDLQKEKLRLEIQKLKQETSFNAENLENDIAIKKKKSNFYESLDKYPKVDKVSFAIVDDRKEEIVKSRAVLKSEFGEFILATDDLEPLEVEDAVIEIIAPVLKKGNYKWIGFYQGGAIAFNMKSNEFKTLVQSGNVEFKNGSSINCHLQIKRKIDNEGRILNVGYDVTRVNEYFENENPIETKEGKHHRQLKEAKKKQLKLFGHTSDDNSSE